MSDNVLRALYALRKYNRGNVETTALMNEKGLVEARVHVDGNRYYQSEEYPKFPELANALLDLWEHCRAWYAEALFDYESEREFLENTPEVHTPKRDLVMYCVCAIERRSARPIHAEQYQPIECYDDLMDANEAANLEARNDADYGLFIFTVITLGVWRFC